MIYIPFHSVLDMLIQKMTKKLQIIKVNKKVWLFWSRNYFVIPYTSDIRYFTWTELTSILFHHYKFTFFKLYIRKIIQNETYFAEHRKCLIFIPISIYLVTPIVEFQLFAQSFSCWCWCRAENIYSMKCLLSESFCLSISMAKEGKARLFLFN